MTTGTPESGSKLHAVHSRIRKDILHSAIGLGVTTAVWSGIFGGLQHLQSDPTFFQNHGFGGLDGVSSGLFHAADFAGKTASDHLPLLGPTSQFLHSTPLGNVLNENLIADVEIGATLSTLGRIVRVGSKSAQRYIDHAEDMQKATDGGEADMPENVKRNVQALKWVRRGLVAADAVVETGELFADPTPYGLRDLDALGFLLSGWHPLTGNMNLLDKGVMAVSIAIPEVPPLVIYGPYGLARNTVRGIFRRHRNQ